MVFFVWVSLLVSDLLSLAASSKTRASPQWSPASFGLAASSYGRVGPSRSSRGLHALRKSVHGPARVGHSLSSKERLGAPLDAGPDLDFWFMVFYFLSAFFHSLPL